MTISVLKRKIADEFNKLTTLEEQLEFIVEMGLELSLEENVTYGQHYIASDVINHVCFRGVEAMDVKMNALRCGRLSAEDLIKFRDLGVVVHGEYRLYHSNQLNGIKL